MKSRPSPASPAPGPAVPHPVEPRSRRFDRLDAWRGAAIVWMACFHFAFDLNMYGYLHPHQRIFLDPFWTTQRFCIVSMFLLGAGASQAVAIDAGQSWLRFWRRWTQVAGCALLVSLGSLTMFPDSWISFGVLHGMAVMLVVLRTLGTRLPPARVARRSAAFAVLALLAALAWTLPRGVHAPFFDTRLTNWIGLVTRLPVTEDYVPVLPWLGMMLAGYLGASLLLAYRCAAGREPGGDPARNALAGPVPAIVRPLAALGRWSLSFYMLHQPILIGSLITFKWLTQ